MVRQLGSALGACHAQRVVHRDVKPTNLVMKRGEKQPWPILIDFGLAYEPDLPRLTDSREAVGYRRFSPDPARSRMEGVPAWLDVFALALLVIWMLDEQASDSGSWLRPLHWRYAKYDRRLGGKRCWQSIPSPQRVHSSRVRRSTARSVWNCWNDCSPRTTPPCPAKIRRLNLRK